MRKTGNNWLKYRNVRTVTEVYTEYYRSAEENSAEKEKMPGYAVLKKSWSYPGKGKREDILGREKKKTWAKIRQQKSLLHLKNYI